MRELPGDSESGENPIMPNILIQAHADSRRGLIQALTVFIGNHND